jgi:hypothetical protein
MTNRTEAEQEAGLDEHMAAASEAEEIFGTFSPQHLAAIDAYAEFACSWTGPEPEPELEAEP